MKKIIYNGTLVNDGKMAHGYVIVDGDVIAEVGENAPSQDVLDACDERYDVNGALVFPGVIDDHVHFRDPGMTHKADIATESRAAVAGGVTSFMDMPNNKPFTTTLETLEAKYARAAQVSLANYSFYIGATDLNFDVIQQVDFSRVCGVKAFLGSSTGGMLLADPYATRRLFKEIPAIIAIHSEDEEIIKANKAYFMAEQGGDDLPLCYHSRIRSARACFESTRRAVELAQRCGTRLHVLHITTAKELELFSAAPLAEKRITAEACPAHLLFTEADYLHLDARIKCNPSVKTESDRTAIRQAVVDGRVDVIGTDHAPHLLSEKQGGSIKATSGMPMLQFSLIAMLELAHQGVFTPTLVAQKMCHASAELYRMKNRGYLRKGYKADIAVVDTVKDGWTITDDDVISRCAWTPLNGMKVHNRVAMTFVNGNLAYDHGKVNDEVRGERLEFNN